MDNRTGIQILALIVAVAIPLLVGALGGLATAEAVDDWYTQLPRPSWTPPAWVFGPVWTVLYVVMGLAAWLVWRTGWPGTLAWVALGLFGAQLVSNLLWSVLFFGLRSPGWAVVDIVLLWGLIVATTALFFRIVPLAGMLMVPYLLWVTFATVLNVAIWRALA